MKYSVDMPDEMGLLASTLLERTRQKEIEWSVTDAEDGYLYSGTRSAMLISGDPYGDIYSLQLLNYKGSVVAALQTEELGDTPRDDALSEVLKDLYHEARSNALEIEGTLKDIHQALGIQLKGTEYRPSVKEIDSGEE